MTTIELPPIAPQQSPIPGHLHPQEKALLSEADLIVFGGQAGGGKTWTAAYFAGRWNHVPGYGALVTRRESPELTGSGGIWDQAKTLYREWGARTTESPMNATWPNGARVEFRHMQLESDVEKHDGMQYGALVVDEAQMWTMRMIWYLWGRCRTMAQIDGVGIKAQCLLTCNPDPDCDLRKLLDWWIGEDGLPVPARDGVLRWCVRADAEEVKWFESEAAAHEWVRDMRAANPDDPVYEHMRPTSITFIGSKLADNRKMLEVDPTYGARLAMGDAITRARKLGGNWNARATSGALFSRTWFGVVEEQPDWSQVHCAVRGWDIASRAPTPEYPDPDYTWGALWLLLMDGRLCCADSVYCKESPGAVDQLLARVVQADGPRVIQAFWQDPGSAGVRDGEYLVRIARGALPSVQVEVEVATQKKVPYASPLSARLDPRTKHNQTQGLVVRGAWNSEFFHQLEAFPSPGDRVHDDAVDASSRAWLELSKQSTGWMEDFTRAMKQGR